MIQRLKQKLATGAAALALTAGIALGGAAPAHAEYCQDEWNDSNIGGMCSDVFILGGEERHAVTQVTSYTCIITASCSFNVTHGVNGSESTTVTGSLSMRVLHPRSIALLTFCVSESTDSDGNNTYSTSGIHTACNGADEYTAAEVQNGQFHD